MSRKQHNLAKRIGPYSRPRSIATVDKRTREGKLLRQIAADLRDHCGDPTVPEQMLIEATAFLWLQINQLAPRLLAGEVGDGDSGDRQVLAYINSMRRNLETLGYARPTKALPSLRQYIEAKGTVEPVEHTMTTAERAVAKRNAAARAAVAADPKGTP